MLKVGFIGWRGMVGSVLMQRMRDGGDFQGIEPTFFSTSAAGTVGPTLGGHAHRLEDARDVALLRKFDVLLSCQGGGYTLDMYPKLRGAGWKGYWIDAASALRMHEEAVLVLDPVNREVIDRALAAGARTFCGANCTVSLMLMALHGLFAADQVEWLSSMTYQAASGAGAQHMRELVSQMTSISEHGASALADPQASALELDTKVAAALADPKFPTQEFGVPLAASLIPWIDRAVEGGQTREEWKGFAETNKILDRTDPIAVDGLCVRVGSMRCHAQAFTLKLRSEIALDEVTSLLADANPWVRVIDNAPEESKRELSPARVSGTLSVPVGRIRPMRMGPSYFTAFTVGDQLLWGAAEPLRRMLLILREQL